MKTAFIHGVVSPHVQNCTAFVIEDNKFIYVGDDETASSFTDHILDLNGQCVLPGFNDSHMHLLNTGSFLANLDLTKAHSAQDIYDLVKEKAKTYTEQMWICGRGFNQDNFTDGSMITKTELDAITDCPVALVRCCGHMMVVNSKALELANIDEHTTIDGGGIDFEHGWLSENANERIKAAQTYTTKQIEELILKGAQFCNQYGITSVQSDDFMTLTQHYNQVLDAYHHLDKQDLLTVRVHEQCQFPDLNTFKEFLEDERRHYHTDTLSMGPLKMLQDGSLGARTAALSEPYHDDPSTSGMIVIPQKTLEDFLTLAKQHNMAAAVHVIGDEACETVLKAYEKINDTDNPLRNGLVHVQITREDQLKRIADLKLHGYIQSIFVDYDARIVQERVGSLEETSYAFKTLSDTSTISNGSDSPVELPDVLKGIECAVSRTSITDASRSLNKKEALSVKEAINSYTTGGAYASFEEHLKGKIAVGMLADFVILDQNPMMVPVHQIHEIQVKETWMNGKKVYSKA